MTSAPRAILLGWGQRDAVPARGLRRVYRSLGLDSSGVIASTVRGLADPHAYGRALAPLAGELAKEAGERPLVVHLFSDNGFIAWARCSTHSPPPRTEGARATPFAG